MQFSLLSKNVFSKSAQIFQKPDTVSSTTVNFWQDRRRSEIYQSNNYELKADIKRLGSHAGGPDVVCLNKKALQGENIHTSCISFSLSQNTHRTTQTNAVNKQKSPPWACDIKDAQKLAHSVFPPWRPTLTSRSLQSSFVKSLEMLGFWSFIYLKDLGRKIFTQISFRMVRFSVW